MPFCWGRGTLHTQASDRIAIGVIFGPELQVCQRSKALSGNIETVKPSFKKTSQGLGRGPSTLTEKQIPRCLAVMQLTGHAQRSRS